ncbi:MAG: rRNA maturation RNase YbeY [Parcubacteria group bacterium]|nr:rRNA maturation RNase YbeY [Parcubacteria group bacterium]
MPFQIDFYQRAGLKKKWPISKNFVRSVLAAAGINEIKLFYLSVAAVGSRRIKGMNKEHRGIDEETDVLSFGSLGEGWGEIIICYPIMAKQARLYGHPIEEEFKILLTHGLLHLAGYDHETNEQYLKMKALEDKIIGDHKGLICR